MNTFFLPGAYIIQSVSKKKLHPHFLSFAQKFVQVEAQLKGTLKGAKKSKKNLHYGNWKIYLQQFFF